MDMIFMFIAVCPTVFVVGYKMKGTVFVWEKALYQFAKWFFGITLFDLIVLYLRGAGDFDFTYLSVQFVLKYMLCSIGAVIFLSGICKLAEAMLRKKDKR